ncbi:DUF2075 domain-containing protein [Salipaludibacillus sp. CF4.18]|uniref:DUF2075 domain-containing protein n=1 Tax=Salipaludibacillus sp. CF4.18 TaxID=3373081 RepID=UPI003EE81534
MNSELIFEKGSFNRQALDQVQTVYLNNYPMVYVLYNQKRKIAYIGQTVHKKRRLHTHLTNPKRHIHNETIVIGHEKFNQSATYNIESNLINYFIADNQYKLQNVSQTANMQMHNYFQKEYFNEEIFGEIWDKLREENLVKETVENLRNKDIYKLSPYKELSEQQLDVKNRILDFCKKNINNEGHHVFIVEGDAGTGKSVLLSSLFNTIQDYANEDSSDLKDTNNFLLVNHSEMLKTYKSIANSLPNLKKKNFLKPTPFVNQMDKTNTQADIVLVDEAHLLLTKEDSYNNFRYENHLDEIIKRCKITIVIFDPKQVLKLKSYWNQRLIQEITRHYSAETMQLTDQFRMKASPETLNWINHFVSKSLLPLPSNEDQEFEFKIYDNGRQFKEAIQSKNEKYGLSRIVSTFDYLHKKDGKEYYVDEHEDGVNLPWNITGNNITWAEEAHTIYEVGSIYTVQGFDLNYVGVVLGPSLSYDDETDRIVIDIQKYKDTGAFTSRKDIDTDQAEQIKEDIILNSINVLMKRGIRGLYIYAVDPKLSAKLQSLIKENEPDE